MPRVAVTDAALERTYHRQGMTFVNAAAHSGVSDEYPRRRIADAGPPRRPGTFAPRTAWAPDAFADRGGGPLCEGVDAGDRCSASAGIQPV